MSRHPEADRRERLAAEHGGARADVDPLREIRQRLAAIPDSLALLEGIFAFAPVGFQIYDVTGRSILTNQAFRELFGSEPPPEYNVLKDEIAAEQGVLHLVEKAFAGEVVSTPAIWYDPRALKQVTVAEGRRVAIRTTFFPLRDGAGKVSHVAIVFKDVTAELTAQLKAEELAQQSAAQEKWLEMILNHMPTPLLFIEPGTARVFFANAAADKIAGGRMPHAQSAEDFARLYPCTDLEGRPIPAEDMPGVRAARGQEPKVTQLRWHLAGGEKTVRIESARLPAAFGKPETVLVAFDDVTAMKEVEAQLQESVRVREDFVSIAGHEMKTPLTALQLTVESVARLLRQTPFDPETIGAATGVMPAINPQVIVKVDSVIRQARRLARLVDQLLDVSRIASGRFKLEPERFDLTELVATIIARTTEELGPAPAPIHLLSDGPLTGIWDRLRVDQVITNLISNAVKYGEKTAVHVTVRRTETGGEITVRDQGIGIEPAQQERIFERFERVVSDRNFGGLGLGLWIVRQIVDAMDGRIRVESEVGRGAMFAVELPSMSERRQ